jgi:ATP-dependent Clp protease ATP-binding subunit ClpB
MRLDKLTVKAQEALMATQGLASEAGHVAMTPLHLLRALLDQEGGLVCRPIASGASSNPSSAACRRNPAAPAWGWTKH